MCCAARVCIGFWPDFHPASFYASPFTSALTAVRMQLTGQRSFNASSSVKLAHSNKAAGPSAEREAKTRRPVCFSMWSGVFYAGVMAGSRLVRRIGSLPNLPKRRGVHTFQVLGSGRYIVFELCTVHCRCLLFHAGRPHGDAVAIVTFDPAQHVCPPSQRSERESRNTFS